MRLIFIGSTRFGLKCLEKVLPMPEIEVVGIITNRPTFSISYRPGGCKMYCMPTSDPWRAGTVYLSGSWREA